jgi:hypothetical protein
MMKGFESGKFTGDPPRIEEEGNCGPGDLLSMTSMILLRWDLSNLWVSRDPTVENSEDHDPLFGNHDIAVQKRESIEFWALA